MVGTTISIVKWTGIALALALGLLLLGSLAPGGYQLRIVQTGSMRPIIPIGSVVIVSAAPTYTIGDILTFQRAGDREATTHRLVKIYETAAGQRLFTVKGDANNADDMRPVLPSEVIGKVHFILPYLGYLFVAARGPVGFLILIIVPIGLIILEQGKRVMVEVKETSSQSTS